MSNSKKRSRAWVLVALLPVCGGAIFFSMRALSRTAPKIDPEKLVKVERIDLARSVVATGKIEPTTKVEIKSKASGIILKLPVNVGDRVRQGQVICELDQNDLLPRVRQAQASLGMAEASLKSAQAEYERAKVEAAGPDIPFLKRDMDRAREMFLAKVAAQTTRDDAEKNYELAKNRQQQAVVNLGVSNAAIRKAEAQVEQSRAQLATTEEDLRNATIVSPIDGVVLSRDREVGDAVSSILTDGVRRYVDHVGGRSTRSLRQGQGRRERYRQGVSGTGGAHYGGILQGPEIRRQGHEDIAHGSGEGQRHHFRSAGLHL